jgi:hypothetical protein
MTAVSWKLPLTGEGGSSPIDPYSEDADGDLCEAKDSGKRRFGDKLSLVIEFSSEPSAESTAEVPNAAVGGEAEPFIDNAPQ